jgi:hypothetical protein
MEQAVQIASQILSLVLKFTSDMRDADREDWAKTKAELERLVGEINRDIASGILAKQAAQLEALRNSKR